MSAETTNSIQILLNGEPRRFPSGTTLSAIVAELNIPPDRLAIECDRQIVRRELWPSTVVDQGAEIELVQFVGGG